jgi:hypothetical protein
MFAGRGSGDVVLRFVLVLVRMIHMLGIHKKRGGFAYPPRQHFPPLRAIFSRNENPSFTPSYSCTNPR